MGASDLAHQQDPFSLVDLGIPKILKHSQYESERNPSFYRCQILKKWQPKCLAMEIYWDKLLGCQTVKNTRLDNHSFIPGIGHHCKSTR